MEIADLILNKGNDFVRKNLLTYLKYSTKLFCRRVNQIYTHQYFLIKRIIYIFRRYEHRYIVNRS